MGYIIDSDQKEELGRMSGEYLMQTVVHSHSFVSDDATITDIFLFQAGPPVFSGFCETIAQHDDVFRADSRFFFELKETFVIMVCIGAFGRVDRCCYGIGYQ